MGHLTRGWIGLIVALYIAYFGVFWFIVTLFSIIAFFLGIYVYICTSDWSIDDFYRIHSNPLEMEEVFEGGVPDIIREMENPKKVLKSDSRMTGSDLIDSPLQEIINYIIRDYITPWYSIISDNTDFPEVAVRETVQTVAINISNQVKQVDWLTYLTTRLVDDAASHYRLFKQARIRMKHWQMEHSRSKGSPMRDKSSPRKSHKRNKSETDINWYFGKNDGNFRKDVEKSVGNSRFYSSTGRKYTLEEHFFDLECQMERNLICRDTICTDKNFEKDFLSEITEILLFLFLPEEDFDCNAVKFVLREVIAKCVLLPLFNIICEPDFINQTIIRLCMKNSQMPNSEHFLTVLRLTDHYDELKSTKLIVDQEIKQLRNREKDDSAARQQLSSLLYVSKLIDTRLSKMDKAQNDGDMEIDHISKINLSLEQILKSDVALSYFIDFILSQGKSNDLFFYLNVDGWKVSVEQQLSESSSEISASTYESIRSTAFSIYEQYLGEKSDQKVQISPLSVQKLHFKIRNLHEPPNAHWFDEVQAATFHRLENDPNFLPAFRDSKGYVKLLQELDLLQQAVAAEEEVPEKVRKHARSFSDASVSNVKVVNANLTVDSSQVALEQVENKSDLRVGLYNLDVQIIETGVIKEKGKPFGIYVLSVKREYESGFIEEWSIYRRYSDFHDLCSKIKDKYPDLSKLQFPGKKTFHNMDREVLEHRKKLLGIYMKNLCRSVILNSHSGLRELLMTFLEQGEYDRQAGGPIASTINSIVNPLKSGMKTIKNMPEQFANRVDEVVEGLSKVFQSKPQKMPETTKVGASIEETDDNIPLRIMLLFMDEVFDLKSRNQWLRRRIVTLLRQILRTMFGDIVNRRILEYVSSVTSPKNVAYYLSLFRDSFWPNGKKSTQKLERDHHTRNRTRVAAKTALLASLVDEFKHFIGSDTTRKGLISIFDLFQYPTLNRRLIYVLFEGVLCTLFPDRDLANVFQHFFAKSPRINRKNS